MGQGSQLGQRTQFSSERPGLRPIQDGRVLKESSNNAQQSLLVKKKGHSHSTDDTETTQSYRNGTAGVPRRGTYITIKHVPINTNAITVQAGGGYNDT